MANINNNYTRSESPCRVHTTHYQENVPSYQEDVFSYLEAVKNKKWLSLEQFKEIGENSSVCSYSPPRGIYRDLFCGEQSVEGNDITQKRCIEHKDRIGRGGILLGKIWITEEEFLERSKKEELCSYYSFSGKNKNLYCSSKKDIVDQRCYLHPKRDEKLSIWHDVDTFLCVGLHKEQLCTYSPCSGENKGKICSTKSTEFNEDPYDRRCQIHEDQVGCEREVLIIPGKVKIPISVEVCISRWLSVSEYITSLLQGRYNLCAYSPNKGSNLNTICCDKVTRLNKDLNIKSAEDFWNLRCNKCWGKRGVGQDLIMKAGFAMMNGNTIVCELLEEKLSPKKTPVKTTRKEKMPANKDLVQSEEISHCPSEEDEKEIEVAIGKNLSLQNLLGELWFILPKMYKNGHNYLIRLENLSELIVYGYFEDTLDLYGNITRDMLDNLNRLEESDVNILAAHGICNIGSPEEIF